MTTSRRTLLASALFGAGYVGLRALATGLPAAALLKGRNAVAQVGACTDPSKAQFIIFNTLGSGDPLNANCPGTYADSRIVHTSDPLMAATSLTLAGTPTTAAKPWSTLPQSVLDRTCFWHLRTNTPIHPEEPSVLKLYGATAPSEMLPSLLSKHQAACLGTVQAQPLTLGAVNPSEALSYEGRALPSLPPLALKTTLTNPRGPLSNLQALRDDTLGKLDGIYRNQATKAQRAYLDSVMTSQTQARNINQDLLEALSSITDNSVEAQIKAAIVLIRMNVTPVVGIRIPFGGDNHNDTGLVEETTETISGVAAIKSMMEQLAAAGLSDRVTFMSLNVFGRTLGAGSLGGRQHNENHQVSLTIGKAFRGGVIGGVRPVGDDFGCTGIDPTTGRTGTGIAAGETLASFGKTTLASVGVADEVIGYAISAGQVVSGALA
ncbi:MAG: DUF1501 domain-containing protein [Deltaproteobacteria bacterium]|nr:DUF1501 domain-containing protein [Deltaproteobacteria bacterium]